MMPPTDPLSRSFSCEAPEVRQDMNFLRLYSFERKLKMQPQFYKSYLDFMRDLTVRTLNI